MLLFWVFIRKNATLFTVKSDIFVSILFLRIALNDIFATLKICDYVMIYLISNRQSDYNILRWLKHLRKVQNLQYFGLYNIER